MKWYLAYEENYKCSDKTVKTVSDIRKENFDVISASVPGNVELDMINAGKLDDLYYSTNTLQAQKLENLHYWYFSEFELEDTDVYLCFEGIDTVADIYVNGELVKTVDNMFVSHDVYADFKQGKNEVVVHIKPVCIEARKYTVPASGFAQKYNYESLYIRKASHMYGWDIMPRIVSAGLWKPVEIKPVKKDKIKEVYFVTNKIDFSENCANMTFYISTDISGDFATDYSIKVHGECQDSSFDFSQKLYHTSLQSYFCINNAKAW